MKEDMEKLLDKILDKLDVLTEKQSNLNTLLERLTVTVEIHEKRSTALESELKRIEKEELLPIKKHITQVQFIINSLKFIGIPSIISLVVYIISKVQNWGLSYDYTRIS